MKSIIGVNMLLGTGHYLCRGGGGGGREKYIGKIKISVRPPSRPGN